MAELAAPEPELNPAEAVRARADARPALDLGRDPLAGAHLGRGPTLARRGRAAHPAASPLRRPRRANTATLMTNEGPISPDSSRPSPATCIPVARAIAKTIAHTKAARITAETPKPAITAERSCADTKSRRVKPESKSAAIEKPMNTPPKAADWSNTNTNWNAL